MVDTHQVAEGLGLVEQVAFGRLYETDPSSPLLLLYTFKTVETYKTVTYKT